MCRMGLVAALLVWSGWPQRWPVTWALLSLPLADAFLSWLALLWPRVLKERGYVYLVRGVHDLYRLVVVVLFSDGLLSDQDVPWSLLVGGGVRTADGARARGEIEEDGTWRLELEGHFIFTWKPRNFFEERILLIFFRQFRTPQSSPKRPFVRQEWLAEWFDTYQELISRWQKYVRQGGLEKLNGEYEGWVVTPEIRQAIVDIWTSNFWLGAGQVRERLLTAGHISCLEDISEGSIHQVARETGFAEVRRLLRHMFKFTADGPQWRHEVLIERLFELNERLITLLQTGEALTPQLTLEVASLKQALGAPVTPLKKTLPFTYRLQQAFFGQWQEMDDGRTRCPHCGSALVARKENTPRRKKYRDPETEEWRETQGYRY
jgi:hypothetical protein